MSGPVRAPFNSKQGRAIKALYAGEATPEEQKVALDWILVDASGVRRPSYVSGQDGRRDTDFNEGSKWVGSQIVYLMDTVTLKELATMEKKEKQSG